MIAVNAESCHARGGELGAALFYPSGFVMEFVMRATPLSHKDRSIPFRCPHPSSIPSASYLSQMRSMMSNPAVMQQMMDSNPMTRQMMQGNPQVEEEVPQENRGGALFLVMSMC